MFKAYSGLSHEKGKITICDSLHAFSISKYYSVSNQFRVFLWLIFVILICNLYYKILTWSIVDPIPMAAVVGVTLTILIAFLILVIALLIAYKKEKLCFKSKFNLIKFL